VERRSRPRIENSFPATVRGVTASGEAYETNTVLENLSARGLYLSVMHEVEQGAKLSIVIQFATGPTVDEAKPRVEVFGEVLRAEREWSGACGIAVSFKGYRFL
jgi:PilZ domain-containing protein